LRIHQLTILVQIPEIYTEFTNLIEPERRHLSQLPSKWADFFRRNRDQRARSDYFFSILDDLDDFVHSDEEGVGRRADSCGVVWLSTAIAISIIKLPPVIGRKRSWINRCLAPLSFTFNGPKEELDVIRELTQVLGSCRYNARTAAHWTFRRRPTKLISDESLNDVDDFMPGDQDSF
jgi:hypothetical protein